MNIIWTCPYFGCKNPTERTSKYVLEITHLHDNTIYNLHRVKKNPVTIGSGINGSLGFKPRKGGYFKCSYCGAKVYKRINFSNRKNHFCSRQHHNLYQKENKFELDCVICGKTFYCQPSQVKLRGRKTCSRKCKGELATIEAKNRILSGQKTKHQTDRYERYSKEAKKWRVAVFKRDDYTCKACGIRGGYLEAHHILPFAFFPEKRYEIDNGMTMCRECHNKTKTDFKKMRRLYESKSIR